jgi:hypothetical protein
MEVTLLKQSTVLPIMRVIAIYVLSILLGLGEHNTGKLNNKGQYYDFHSCLIYDVSFVRLFTCYCLLLCVANV